jgi:general secretion pathway protein H
MTLIEILIVLAIMGIMVGAVIAGSGQLASARLHHTSTMLAGAVKVAYARATATSKNVRIVFDLEEDTFWIEESDQPMLVQSKDVTGTGGAEAATQAEQQAVEEGDRIVKGPRAPKPRFKMVESVGLASSQVKKGPRSLERGIKFREIQTSHDDKPRTEGRAYLYFWPGGMTERAAILLSVGDLKEDGSTQTLMVSPLTGKVTVKDGAVPMKKIESDKEASDRDDPSSF